LQETHLNKIKQLFKRMGADETGQGNPLLTDQPFAAVMY